jgi:hypothetical protein
VPDLVRVAPKIDNFLRQLVMSVRENKYLHGGSASPKTMLNRVEDNAIHLKPSTRIAL